MQCAALRGSSDYTSYLKRLMFLAGLWQDRGMELQRLLLETLEARCSKNPGYSLRAFARDLGLSAQSLSHIMNGNRGISREKGQVIAEKIGLSETEKEELITFIEARYSRSPRIRDEAAKRMILLQGMMKSDLALESFKMISGWYHLALLTLLQIERKIQSPKFLAARLGISVYEVKASLERLLKLKMLKIESQRYIPEQDYFINKNGTSSQSVKTFHEQILDKAKTALTLQKVQERDFSVVFLPIDPDRVDEIKEEIRVFRKRIEQKFSSSPENCKEVYALGVQLFRISEQCPTDQNKGENQ